MPEKITLQTLFFIYLFIFLFFFFLFFFHSKKITVELQAVVIQLCDICTYLQKKTIAPVLSYSAQS